MRKRFNARGVVWLYPGTAGWHFLTVPKVTSRTIKKTFGAMARGWGSLPVIVTIGKIEWKTSIFPDSKAGAYLLPLKAVVRKKLGINRGDTVSYVLEIRSAHASE